MKYVIIYNYLFPTNKLVRTGGVLFCSHMTQLKAAILNVTRRAFVGGPPDINLF